MNIDKQVIAEYVKKYTEYGLATGDPDMDAAEKFIEWLYVKRLYKAKPKKIIVMDSPKEALIAAMYMHFNLRRPDENPLVSQWNIYRHNTFRSYNKMYFMTNLHRNTVASPLREIGIVIKTIISSVVSQTSEEDYKTVVRNMNRSISRNVIRNVGFRIENCLEPNTANSQFFIKKYGMMKIKRKLESYIGEEINKNSTTYLMDIMNHYPWVRYQYQRMFPAVMVHGQFRAHRYAMVDYFMNHNEIKISKVLKEEYDIFKNSLFCIAGVFFVFGEYCIIPKRPKIIKLNSNGRLHSDNTACLEYDDGIKLYYMNGIPVDKQFVVKKPEKITPESVLNIQNVDARREVVRKVGLHRIMKGKLPCHISKNPKLSSYALYMMQILGRKAMFLEMKNPSTGDTHVEGVHPSCDTVEEALAWRNKLSGSYIIPKILT